MVAFLEDPHVHFTPLHSSNAAAHLGFCLAKAL